MDVNEHVRVGIYVCVYKSARNHNQEPIPSMQ